MILNSMIYKIHTEEDFTHMRSNLLEQMKRIVDFDSGDFYLSKGNGSPNLESQITYNCKEDVSSLYEDMDYSQGILSSGKSMVYRETDIISDEKRVETDYYKKVYKVNHWHFSIQMVLAYEEEFLGVITLYRTLGKENFAYDDIFLLEMIKEHLSYRLHKEKIKVQEAGEKLTITQATQCFDLTKKESTILSYIMEGLDNQEICDRNVITNNTLKKHVLNIYRKIGVRNRVQLFKKIKEKE